MSAQSLADCDRLLVRVARRIRLLGALSYPEKAADRFLAAWRAGRPRLPHPPAVKPVAASVVEGLREVRRKADAGSPLGRYLRDTADSYLEAVALRTCAGTPEFHQVSRRVYGSPDDALPGGAASHLEAADNLLDATLALAAATHEHEADYCLSAEHVAAEIARRVAPFFADDPIAVVIDPNLSAKAAASAKRIRLRGRTCFSQNDIEQLIEHEAFVHSATALNGKKQPKLASLSLGAPRTTATQEGLATMAELITGAMELARLRRLALRIRAVHLAMEGADFLEVFHYLLEAGQTESESVHTSLRIFRGADPRGGHPFTKDVVYLRGLFAVHTFLRRAIVDIRPELIARLFLGRLTLGDVLAFEEPCATGALAPARYVPVWASEIRRLAAYLSFSAVIYRIDLGALTLEDLAA